MAHTATSYHLGRKGEANLLARLEKSTGKHVITAFGSVLAGPRAAGMCAGSRSAPPIRGRRHCRVRRIWKRTAWRSSISANLSGVTNIYDETAERAYGLARLIDREDAEAVFLSGTGMPTLPVLEAARNRIWGSRSYRVLPR